jgi:hypothetical protein
LWSTLLLSLAAVDLTETQGTAPAGPSARLPPIDYATVTVEREAFYAEESKPGQYGTVGKFQGVGMMYVSLTNRTMFFHGLRLITWPYLGQDKTDQYELFRETFTLRSAIRSANDEYAFEAVSDLTGRTLTGRLRYARSTIFFPQAVVVDCQFEEHGRQVKGVMNRYVLPRSPAALQMLKEFEKVHLGGNAVLFEYQSTQ